MYIQRGVVSIASISVTIPRIFTKNRRDQIRHTPSSPLPPQAVAGFKLYVVHRYVERLVCAIHVPNYEYVSRDVARNLLREGRMP